MSGKSINNKRRKKNKNKIKSFIQYPLGVAVPKIAVAVEINRSAIFVPCICSRDDLNSHFFKKSIVKLKPQDFIAFEDSGVEQIMHVTSCSLFFH